MTSDHLTTEQLKEELNRWVKKAREAPSCYGINDALKASLLLMQEMLAKIELLEKNTIKYDPDSAWATIPVNTCVPKMTITTNCGGAGGGGGGAASWSYSTPQGKVEGNDQSPPIPPAKQPATVNPVLMTCKDVMEKYEGIEMTYGSKEALKACSSAFVPQDPIEHEMLGTFLETYKGFRIHAYWPVTDLGSDVAYMVYNENGISSGLPHRTKALAKMWIDSNVPK
jgi:hypothetical protein